MMIDRAELRRLAEDMKSARAAMMGHSCTYEEGFAWCSSPLHDDMVEAIDAFSTAASPDVVLGLLDEIERLKGECDFFSARSEEERTNRGLAEKDFHDAMELVRKYSAERDQLRAVAVRLKGALQELESRVFEDGAPDDVLEETQGILADPEVEKL